MTPSECEQQIVDTWDFDDPAASYDAFVDAVHAVGPGTPEGLVLRTQQARALGLQGHRGEAAALLDAVAADLTSDRGLGETQRHHVTARLEIERGRVLNSGGSPELAKPHFGTAYDEATAAGLDGLAVDALHMSAIVAGRTEGSDGGAELNNRAIALAEKSSDPAARRWLGSLLNNLGWDKHDAGRYDEALDIFKRALVARVDQGTKREVEVARWCVGRCLRSMERYAEALEIQETLADSASGSEDGYVYEEIGENLMALGRGDEAAPYFSRAHELLSDDDWMVDNESERLERLLFLSDD